MFHKNQDNMSDVISSQSKTMMSSLAITKLLSSIPNPNIQKLHELSLKITANLVAQKTSFKFSEYRYVLECSIIRLKKHNEKATDF